MKFDAFISYASEDKVTFVRSLAKELTNKGFKVWFDEYELKAGDKLRSSIDKGLINSYYGIIVLSKNFFKKKWSQYELDGLVHLMNSIDKKILPIWHNITFKELLKISPSLADLFALQSKTSSIKEIGKELAKVLGRKRFTYQKPNISISKDYYPLSMDARERGFETIASIQKDIIINRKTTHIKLEKTIVPSFNDLKSFQFYHWQEDKGEIKLNGTDVYDAITGVLLPHKIKILKNDGCEFKLRINFKALPLNPVTIIVEINTSNYFYNLFRNSYGYTEFTLLYGIKYFEYHFITPNQSEYQTMSAHLDDKVLPKKKSKTEINSTFKMKDLVRGKNLRFTIIKR